MSVFKSYQHIERYGTEEVEGIDIGVCYIFPKLDGTNSSIWYHEGNLWAGSRNRLLTLDKDNAGFYNWMLQNKSLFMPYFSQHPTHRLYGEFLVKHTIGSYRDDAWRRFWIFDIYDEELNQYLPYDVYSNRLVEMNLDHIPPSHKIKNPTQEQLIKIVEGNTFLIKDGAGAGEGIVIKNYDGYQNKYGRTTWAKLVRNEFKENNKRAFGIKEQDGTKQIESEIAEKYITEHFVNKTKAKIENEIRNAGEIIERGKLIPRLLQTCYHDLIQENIWEICKVFNNPNINFKRLRMFTIHFVKKYASDLF